MTDLLFESFWFEVEKMFSREVRLAFAARARLCGDDKMAAMFMEFETFFHHCVCGSPIWPENRNSFLTDGFSRLITRAKQFIREFAEYLALKPPFLLPYDFASSPLLTEQTAQGQAQILFEAASNSGNGWSLQTTNSKSSGWSETLAARVHVPVELFRLQNKSSGSFCDFYIVENKHAHILLFQIERENQGKFWVAKRDFQSCFNILVKTGIEKLSATVLSDVLQYPLSTTAHEWRKDIVEVDGKKLSKLAVFWQRLGFVPDLAVQKKNPNSVQLVAPRLTSEIKGQFSSAGLPNPYRLLSRSIYGREIEEQLKSESTAAK